MRLWKSFPTHVSRAEHLVAGAGVVILSAVAVTPAHSQFGIDIAAILAGLKQVESTLNSAVATPLKAINRVEQQEQQFQQQVLYPLSAHQRRKADGEQFYEFVCSASASWEQ